MLLFDLSGPVNSSTWHYGSPYFAPKVESLPSPDWMEFPVYAEAISMPMQSGTYIETGGHAFPGRETTAEVPLERSVLLPSVCIQVPTPKASPVTAEMLQKALARLEPVDLKDRGLIVSTGWSSRWFEPDFVTDGPYFSQDAMDFILGSEVGLLGADLPVWDNPRAPTGLLRQFLATQTLMLAPLHAVDRVGDSIGRLIAAPLAVEGTSASLVRAVWVSDSGL